MKNLIFLLALLYSLSIQAKGPNEDVMKVVESLFEGMRKGDSTMVRNVFSEQARLMTVIVKDGQPLLRTGSVDGFVKAVGTPHDKSWNEPIWDFEVKIDGKLAQVWTKYAFYLGDDFSHCGVDAFQLFNGEDGWKIFQLTDTRQFENCELPPNE